MKSLLLKPCSCISLDSAIQWLYFYSSQIGAIEIFQKSVKIFFLNAFSCISSVIFQTALPHYIVKTELRYEPSPVTLTYLYDSSDYFAIETGSLGLPTTSAFLDSPSALSSYIAPVIAHSCCSLGVLQIGRNTYLYKEHM